MRHNQVLSALAAAAWSGSPAEQLSSSQLVDLLSSSAQLGLQPPPALAAVAEQLVLAAAGGGGSSSDGSSAGVTSRGTHWVQSSSHGVVTQQQQRQRRLSQHEIIRVLHALMKLDCLDIAAFGWLLVALAAGPWQRLSPQQLQVLHRAQLALGQDGKDMVTEVLPQQLATRVYQAA